jgi:uncharacterized protein YbaA (DUF1428 family)
MIIIEKMAAFLFAARPRKQPGNERSTARSDDEGKEMPFDSKRMAYGGFTGIVDA